METFQKIQTFILKIILRIGKASFTLHNLLLAKNNAF